MTAVPPDTDVLQTVTKAIDGAAAELNELSIKVRGQNDELGSWKLRRKPGEASY